MLWFAVAVWDLVRRDDRTPGPKLLWLAVVLLVAGGLAAYLAVAGLALATAL